MDRFNPKHHKNPHAHVIHQPGRRLMKGVPLRFVWNKVSGHGARSPNAGLNLVSFIDFLVVTVIFLLMSFSASGEIAVDKNVRLPKAENVEDVIDAPMVAVNGNQILVDGALAGSTRAIEELGRLQKIDELFNLLKNKRELWKQVQPNKPFPGVCILQVDQNVPALVVKSVFQTAAFAGYPNVSFMVSKLPKSQ
ncbi:MULTISPECIES: ExbD/TolR family protein [unclassified Sorangium]|uniref:ExbD/TolR family protein n=1 Tax=unclassified Sorangium TaxID=2621164 RepID=UPI003F5D739D